MHNEKMSERSVMIEYHADDYAMFPAQSRRILDCAENGCLNGVSVMPNSDCLDGCMEELYGLQKDTAVSVHLNLIEGPSLCSREQILLLTDDRGNLNSSFVNLLIHSYLPGRKAYKHQLKQELSAQIAAVRNRLRPGMELRLDSHAHYHMIPVVFDAMMEVLREQELKVEYIRFPREYVRLYLPYLFRLKDFSWINLAKVMILNLLVCRNRCKYSGELENMEQKVFLGVFLSGRMYHENVRLFFEDAVRLARKKKMGLEILAHPGGVAENGDMKKITCRDDLEFLTSDMRDRERSLFVLPLETDAGEISKQKS